MGFFVPDSLSNNYVNTIKTEEGTYKYDNAMNEIGIEKQRAIQNLDKMYSDTINNAYSNYLSSKHNMLMSNLGEGYKQAYIADRQAELASQIAQTDYDAQTARENIMSQIQQSEAAVGQAFNTEVKYMDRVAQSLNDYLEYVKKVRDITNGGQGENYLNGISEFDQQQHVERLYDKLFNASFSENYIDAEGNQALGYIDWIKNNLGTKAEDTDWYNWLTYQGGYNQFKDMIHSSDMYKESQKHINYNKTIEDLYNDFNGTTFKNFGKIIGKVQVDKSIKTADDFMNKVNDFLDAAEVDLKTLSDFIGEDLETRIKEVYKKADKTQMPSNYNILRAIAYLYLQNTNQLNYK